MKEKALNFTRKGKGNSELIEPQQEEQQQEEEEEEETFLSKQQKEKQLQRDINLKEFEDLPVSSKIELQGLTIGAYARIVIKNVPKEFLSFYSPSMPLILGGVKSQEILFFLKFLKSKSFSLNLIS